MKLLVLLSKQHLNLAAAEASALSRRIYHLEEDLIIVESEPELLLSRLGFAHKIIRYLFDCNYADLGPEIDKFNWDAEYNSSFSVRADGIEEEGISKQVFRKLAAPKVNLKTPGTCFFFARRKDRVFCGVLLGNVDKGYLKRKAHLRPKMHPTSLHPGLARALVNLAGLKKGKVMDPFCGSGGILIEAGLMGLSVTGRDIENAQIERAKKNMEFYGLDISGIKAGNALTMSEESDAIVTDMPYGKGSKAKDILRLYPEFLEAAKSMTGKLVIMMPDFLEPDKIVKGSGWCIIGCYKYYVHKSLTRVIFNLRLPYSGS
ncbi:MAG: N-6 DNA methylase [Nanoarchaeota archaeon]|nr:N-6 DNA methylase [Nanoarchaeota archaeon]